MKMRMIMTINMFFLMLLTQFFQSSTSMFLYTHNFLIVCVCVLFCFSEHCQYCILQLCWDQCDQRVVCHHSHGAGLCEDLRDLGVHSSCSVGDIPVPAGGWLFHAHTVLVLCTSQKCASLKIQVLCSFV